jgi:hypothetical protein
MGMALSKRLRMMTTEKYVRIRMKVKNGCDDRKPLWRPRDLHAVSREPVIPARSICRGPQVADVEPLLSRRNEQESELKYILLASLLDV